MNNSTVIFRFTVAMCMFVICMAVTGCGSKDKKVNIEDFADVLAEGNNWIETTTAGAGVGFDSIMSEELDSQLDMLIQVRQENEGISLASIEVVAEEEEDDSDEYSNFAIADVDKYVNVRSGPDTDSEIVGRMYDGAVAQIQNVTQCDDGEWLEVISGSLNGYIKAEYFIYGEAAVAVIDQYIDKYALVKADCLNIRENPNVDSKRIGYALDGEKLKIESTETIESENGDQTQWLKVHYAEDKTGYVSAEYVDVREEFIYAKTMDEIRAQEEAERELLARQKEDEKKKPENVQIVEASTPVATSSFSASGNLRSDIVNFGLQYVGHPYVHGGNSLETGTDCSGFTSLVYAQFGIGLSRTPGGQLSSNGRSISLSEAQPGDIICYGKGSSCTHVAIYIGNGQIVHAANPRKGIVVYNVGYDNIIGVKNVLD